MKILLIGGACQGKRAFAESLYGLTASDFELNGRAIDKLHLRIRELIESCRKPQDEIFALIDKQENWVIICDEIGSGVVPIEKKNRNWREETGRICCAIAQKADRVERITCGISQRLKG